MNEATTRGSLRHQFVAFAVMTAFFLLALGAMRFFGAACPVRA